MARSPFDLDSLASQLKAKLTEDQLSVRSAADEIGCSPATLSRLLKGGGGGITPDGATLIRCVSWLGRGLADFERGRRRKSSSLAEVEVHLRALPGLKPRDAEALVRVVQAAYDAYRMGQKKG